MGMHMKKFKFQGYVRTSQWLADHFGISRAALLTRLKSGWTLTNKGMVHPVYKKRWVADCAIGPVQSRIMRSSFVGDPEMAESLYV